MEEICIGLVAVVVIAWLSIELTRTRARIDGFQEGLRLSSRAFESGVGAARGCFEVLLVVGVLAFLALVVFSCNVL